MTPEFSRAGFARPLALMAAASLLAPLAAAPVQAQSAVLQAHKIAAGTTVSVQLLQGVDSTTAQVGDAVRARVIAGDKSGLPGGTYFIGRVTRARPATAKQPGVLSIQFGVANQNQAAASQGYQSSQGYASGRVATAIANTASAVLVGKSAASDKSQYGTIGAGAGAVLGYSRKRKLGDLIGGAILGGAAGYGANQIQKHNAGDVKLKQGDKLDVRLNTPLTLRTEIVAPY